MRIFKTRLFDQWSKKLNINDEVLYQAIEELSNGQCEANLGGGLFKKRIAMGNKGKSTGLRTIIAFKKAEQCFFLYGFAKNARANITINEKKLLMKLAKDYLQLDKTAIEHLVASKKLIEVYHD